ncbi:hypothetical protein [Streptomyces graminilatus]|uniref:hypothetical protein n=1 Tax=Streptomyces graminilatus TaxID=1464070 RepID=UPI000AD48AB5|nr:hypothetical protein [Streptomyces graminilatus]
METTTIRNWLLPVLLAAGQVAWLWPGAVLSVEELPGAGVLVAVLGATVVETAALGRRRQTPDAPPESGPQPRPQPQPKPSSCSSSSLPRRT